MAPTKAGPIFPLPQTSAEPEPHLYRFEEYVGQSAWMAELVTKGMSMKKKKDKVKEIAKQAPEKIQQARPHSCARVRECVR